MASHGGCCPTKCRGCKVDPLTTAKPPNFCHNCGAKDPLETFPIIINDDCLEPSSRSDSALPTDDCAESSQVASDEDRYNLSEIRDDDRRPESADALGSPNSSAPVQQETGNAGTSSEDTLKWQEGLGSRLCLLIHHADDVFKRDCEAVEQVLKNDRSDSSSTGVTAIVPSKNFDVLHMDYLIERETAILRELMVDDLIHGHSITGDSSSLLMMIYIVYSGLRLLKSKIKLQSSSSLPPFGPNDQNDLAQYTSDISNILIRRWAYWTNYVVINQCTIPEKSKLLLLLMCSTTYCCRSKENFLSADYSAYTGLTALLRDQECEFIFLSDKYKLAEETVQTHAHKLFSRSVYSTGFLTPKLMSEILKDQAIYAYNFYEILRKWFVKYFDLTKLGLSQEKKFSSEEVKDILLLLLDLLSRGKTVCEQWLWIYYSGHNSPNASLLPGFPSRSLRSFFQISRDLFTRIVLCLDCCYPDASRRFSDRHVTGIFACASEETTAIDNRAKLSYFTQELVWVLSGLQPSHRPSWMTCQLDHCPACSRIHQSMVAEGFVFPSYVEDFFKSHSCKSKPEVIYDPVHRTPLLFVGS